ARVHVAPMVGGSIGIAVSRRERAERAYRKTYAGVSVLRDVHERVVVDARVVRRLQADTRALDADDDVVADDAVQVLVQVGVAGQIEQLVVGRGKAEVDATAVARVPGDVHHQVVLDDDVARTALGVDAVGGAIVQEVARHAQADHAYGVDALRVGRALDAGVVDLVAGDDDVAHPGRQLDALAAHVMHDVVLNGDVVAGQRVDRRGVLPVVQVVVPAGADLDAVLAAGDLEALDGAAVAVVLLEVDRGERAVQRGPDYRSGIAGIGLQREAFLPDGQRTPALVIDAGANEDGIAGLGAVDGALDGPEGRFLASGIAVIAIRRDEELGRAGERRDQEQQKYGVSFHGEYLPVPVRGVS